LLIRLCRAYADLVEVLGGAVGEGKQMSDGEGLLARRRGA